MGASQSSGGDSTVSLDAIDLTERASFRHGFPYPIFDTLRREAPVFWHEVPDGYEPTTGAGFWVLSKHEDIQAANRDAELFSAVDGPALRVMPEQRGKIIVAMEGADHTRLRRLISAGFTPRMVKRLDEQARTWAVEIIEGALERSTCDFVTDMAYQLPMHMIADIMGIPVADRPRLFELAADFMMCEDPEHSISLDERPRIQLEMWEYGRKLSAEKRSHPQDDVWTILSTVEVDTESGGRTSLEEIELDLFFLTLTVAGSETTRNAISLGLLALLDNPDQLEFLRKNPAATTAATEEILRWSSPVAYFGRRATRDTRIRGVPITAGDRVTLWYPSGNRDEEVFDEPYRFDVTRRPNHHVSFGGGGPHYCLGANLARREITIFFEELLARTRKIEVLGEPSFCVPGISNPIYLGMKALPVRVEPR